MNWLIYMLARAVVVLIQSLPLVWVARLGRAGGALAFWLDGRHRKVALKNLTMCFSGVKSSAEIRALARENFWRLGENFASAVKTAAMSPAALRPHFEFVGVEKILPPAVSVGSRSLVVAVGHFGNFELYPRFGEFVPWFPLRRNVSRVEAAGAQPHHGFPARAGRLPFL